MDQTTTVVVVIVAIVLVVAIALAVALSRRSRLHDLPPESRDRIVRTWQGVEARFLDDPHGAVQEADKLVVMMLGERGATIHDERKVPAELQKAREAATSDEGRQGTEGMRKAMVHYRHMVDDAVGPELKKRREESGRREVAS